MPSKPPGYIMLQELGKLKTLIDLVGNQTRDLPASSMAPQYT
jgi:hypothetical protein